MHHSNTCFACTPVTTKPMIYVINLSQKNFIRKGSKWLPKIAEWVKSHGGGQCIPVSCEFEQGLYDLRDHPDELKNFLQQCKEEALAAGLKGPQAEVKSMVPRLIRSGRAALCLQSFYTAGPKEVRAWTIMKGALAPQAAGVIHTDFERGFIKAEVANFDDFKALHAGQTSMAKVKEAGKYRQEGKMYAMQDGDMVSLRRLVVFQVCATSDLSSHAFLCLFCYFSGCIYAQRDGLQEEVEHR